MSEDQSDAVWLAGTESGTIEPPRRQVSVSPTSRMQHRPGAIVDLARKCQLQRAGACDMFPPLELLADPARSSTGVLWTVDEPSSVRVLRFAMGFDGSFAYVEKIRESQLSNPIWGAGVGIFTCLDRVIGAMLFARRLARRVSGYQSASLCLSLVGVDRQPLAFDFDTVRGIHASPKKFVCSTDRPTVGGTFDTSIDDTEVESFGALIGDALTYHFGWDWRDEFAAREIHSILGEVVNRDAAS